MCFGKSDDSASREMIAMQKAEAEANRVKEAARQGRITSGLEAIKQMFEGSPVMASKQNSFTANAPGVGTKSGSAVSGLPAGYTYVQVGSPGTPAVAAVPLRDAGSGSGSPGGGGGEAPGAYAKSPYYNNNRQGPQPFTNPKGTGQSGGGGQGAQKDWGGSTGSRITYHTPEAKAAGTALQAAAAGTPGTAGNRRWVIQGPDGKQYEVGSNIGYSSEYDTGKRQGGIGDPFYNEYKQGVVDYYMPQVQEKYKDAGDELTYRLARAGLLRSSMANTETSDLAQQNKLAEGKVLSDADKATADLRTRVASERTKAESQLYATENPEVAANQALASLRNISADTPDLSPLGDIFSLATIGGANALRGYSSEKFRQKIPGYQKSSSIVGR